MSNELFINYLREKGLEPTHKDLEDFEFMARSLLFEEIEKLETMVDNGYSALDAVKCSGSIIDEDVFEMIQSVLDNKPQSNHT